MNKKNDLHSIVYQIINPNKLKKQNRKSQK